MAMSIEEFRKPGWPTTGTMKRIYRIMKELVAEGEYPTAARISKKMGRRVPSLNGSECRFQRYLLRKFGERLEGLER
jgi:hypothetical protein